MSEFGLLCCKVSNNVQCMNLFLPFFTLSLAYIYSTIMVHYADITSLLQNSVAYCIWNDVLLNSSRIEMLRAEKTMDLRVSMLYKSMHKPWFILRKSRVMRWTMNGENFLLTPEDDVNLLMGYIFSWLIILSKENSYRSIKKSSLLQLTVDQLTYFVFFLLLLMTSFCFNTA